ncbi:chromosome partition protein Smc [Hypericibacter terrae]|uniref:Chromosome partition protein Smc n=1 Tax=Hypericibacter terrae TaxID=2602015 RepID=A0A5J6MDU0_9PROT|nr:AAA family ATPase [Hypericibacter terrae]QEX15532.1 chromosome partition protein Smc [Hypericibacter terrae]
MVHFTKLKLVGFKSFVDSTEMPIEPGMTGIVGPNGCGKSNLVEALRWVMGETSAKRMRGGEMDDVIFAGNTGRPARNVAEVVLSLDNADRNVPSQFNGNEALEISRRIDRGVGSHYRVNGSEVRARDVQLLFADAATGAHSTAMVSQGRVGAIISAKPTERRALLEEAAGITGLHSRRHEAELRLRAAEANLARLEDVIVTLEAQFQTLKKQARQAQRYRTIADQLRKAEAVLIHLQWTESQARIEAARQALAEAESAVASATEAAAIAAREQADGASVLPGLRQSEAEAAAALQRLTLARGALEQEEQRVQQQQTEAERRRQQVEGDIGREQALLEDAAAAQARLAEEEAQLTEASAREGDALAEAQRQANDSQAQVETTETELAQLTQTIAEGEARHSALVRRLAELGERLRRLDQRAEATRIERERLTAETEQDLELVAAKHRLAETEDNLAAAETRRGEAEQALTAAEAAETEARAGQQAAQSAHAKLAAEASTLGELFVGTESSSQPPLIDQLQVEPGYEAALGAALGDDLTASTDLAAPVHWQSVSERPDRPDLPAGAEPLSRFVTGSPVLLRRLHQIGVVDSEATGRALADQIGQGQRLVSKDGAMWRWDGYTVATGAPSPAAVRLKQRNRLNEVKRELEGATATLEQAQSTLTRATEARSAAAAEAEAARAAGRQTYQAVDQARSALAQVQQRLAEAVSRLTVLKRTAEEVAAERAETDAQRQQAEADQAALPDLGGARERVAELKPRLAEERGQLIERRGAVERLKREAAIRAERQSTVTRERTSWTQRSEAAQRQLETYQQRLAEIGEEIERLARRPAELAEQRQRLLDEIAGATSARQAAADRLAEAETRLADYDRALKAAEHELGQARENRVRTEGLVAQAEQSGALVIERSQERLEVAPADALALAELDEGAELPDREAVETRIQRLTRERENIGPVNLRAESEAEELETQISGMQNERNDLVSAIARLRQGIASLNREGRERLLAAFEVVNGHFQQLFTRLFGGGRAHLALTEAEDPLEAGLEIMASPPGKKLQVMSLLSGGEQALTALALLFGVFLTNPAPICVLDEVDAPLDDANVDRFCDLVEELARVTTTRFLVITHHRLTMARMDRLFGVTMAERGVSQLVSVDLQRAAELRQSA